MGTSRLQREEQLITATPTPVTKAAIKNGLRDMGLQNGDLVLAHVSLSKLGWVCGAEQTVIEAVQEVLGSTGTLVTPGFSSQLSDPADWDSPPVPASWVQPIRDAMPLFDKHTTPTRGMGRFVETFRHLPDTRRSNHPNDSFLANGPLAVQITSNHPLENPLGKQSPLGQLYDLNVKVLLLGAIYRSCTAFHLAEDGLKGVAQETIRYPSSQKSDITTWIDSRLPCSLEQHFPEIGQVLDATPGVVTFGFNGVARLFPMPIGVDTACKWLNARDLDNG